MGSSVPGLQGDPGRGLGLAPLPGLARRGPTPAVPATRAPWGSRSSGGRSWQRAEDEREPQRTQDGPQAEGRAPWGGGLWAAHLGPMPAVCHVGTAICLSELPQGSAWPRPRSPHLESGTKVLELPRGECGHTCHSVQSEAWGSGSRGDGDYRIPALNPGGQAVTGAETLLSRARGDAGPPWGLPGTAPSSGWCGHHEEWVFSQRRGPDLLGFLTKGEQPTGPGRVSWLQRGSPGRSPGTGGWVPPPWAALRPQGCSQGRLRPFPDPQRAHP